MTKHKLLQPSKESRQDRHGKCWVGLAIAIHYPNLLVYKRGGPLC